MIRFAFALLAISAIGFGPVFCPVKPASLPVDRDEDGNLTVAGLIQELQKMPQDSPVAIGGGVCGYRPLFIDSPKKCYLSEIVFIDSRRWKRNVDLGMLKEWHPDETDRVQVYQLNGGN